MKNIIYLLVSLAVAIAAAFFLHQWLSHYDDPGYVLLGFGNWSLETSLIVFAVALVISFLLFYVFIRTLSWLISMPKKLKSKRQVTKFNRSQEALIAGLVDTAEGNFEQAEKVLIKHATNSGAPLVHYLTAARAAQSRGSMEKRDEYLQLAIEKAPGSDVIVGLTQAQLHLSENQFNEALETLTGIQSLDPEHATTLKLLHETYRKLGDWESLKKLIPSLQSNKILMEAELKLLETETFSMLLKNAANPGNAEQIQQIWSDTPEHIKTMPGINAIYFAAMIEAEAGDQVEDELISALRSDWNETLLVLYGSIQSKDSLKLLSTAEKWLTSFPDDIVLLRVLGKLCMQCGEIAKAEQYLKHSINIEPTVAAYQLLADMYYETDKKELAAENYKLGMELAAERVVSQVA